MEQNYEWYIIPGYSSYDMNIYTGKVRSHKHPNKMIHHIMKENDDGEVTLVDDYGKSKRIDVLKLYNMTFNSGLKRQPRTCDEIRLGHMRKVNRNYKSNVDILNGVYTLLEEQKDPKTQIAFSGFLDAITLDKETKQKTKPFIINPK